MPRKLFVTTALPYANGPFHIGHIMEYVQADIWVRFQRLQGHKVNFVCADDTHGVPIMLRAEAEGVTPKELVARIWQDVLGIDRVGVFDNFFQLGGHSLKATQVLSRISSAFNIDLPLRTIFEAGDVAAMAAIIEDCLINELEKLSDDEAVRLADASESQ